MLSSNHIDGAQSSGWQNGGPPALQINDVTVDAPQGSKWSRMFQHRGVRKIQNILEGVSLTIPCGSWFLLTGPSGSGKSTLLNVINNLVPINRGEILKFGIPVARWSRSMECTPGMRTGTVFQTPSLFRQFTVLENICIGFECRPKTRREEKIAAAHDVLEELGIDELADRYPDELSGGQQQRVAIGRALVAKPDLVILDEPLSALDDASADRVCRLLSRRQKQGVAFVMASHRIEGCIDVCSAKVSMHAGQIVSVDWCNGYRSPGLPSSVAGVAPSLAAAFMSEQINCAT